MSAHEPTKPPRLRWDDLIEGARLSWPMIPGTVVFAAAFGTVAAQKGLTLWEATLMSALVFAGASQLVAMEVWSNPLTLGAIATITLVTATVNMRLVLMSASLRPVLAGFPAWQAYPALLFTVDANWLITMRYRDRPSAAGIFLGGGLAMWIVWVPATIPGYLLGALVTDPRVFGLDFVLPAFFVAMLVPQWRGFRRAIPWAVAAVVALLVERLVGGWWFIIAGALAGSFVGGFADERA
jgi:predicted branched-subunit amino acid permease